MICLLLSTCVYPAVQSSEGRVGVTRSLSRQGSDVTDHAGFCNSGWVGAEEYRGQRTYSPCVPQSQVNTACVLVQYVYGFFLTPCIILFCMVAYIYVCVCCYVCCVVTASHVVPERQCWLQGPGPRHGQWGRGWEWHDTTHSGLPHLSTNTLW